MADLSNYRRNSVEFSNFGQYTVGATVPLLAGQEADSILFSFFWGTPANADFLCAINRIWLAFQQTSASMSAIDDVRFQVFLVREVTSEISGGTIITHRCKARSSQDESLVTTICQSDADGGLIPGTGVIEVGPAVQLQAHVVKTIPTAPVPVFERELKWDTAGAHPLILERDEGLIVCGPTTAFNTGTGNLLVDIEWTELGEY